MNTGSRLSLLLLAATAGCAVVGPTSIAEGRQVYNEVINRTEDEQLLRMIVRERYDETFGLLAVSSVTANISTTARVGSEIGIGPDDNYAGNLVPLTLGFAYEENPTISYIPLSGEDFVQRILSPLTLDQAYLAMGMGTPSDRLTMFRILLARINGIANPLAGNQPPSPELVRFLELEQTLHERGVVSLARSGEGSYVVVFHDFDDDLRGTVKELLGVLGIEKVDVGASKVVVPLQLSIGSRNPAAIEIATRSVMELIQAAGAAIDVPSEHLEEGIVEPREWAGAEEQRFLHIRSSRDYPDDATVAVSHRDYWFYVDAKDARSKRGFIMLKTLIGMRMKSADSAAKPVLTIGVNK